MTLAEAAESENLKWAIERRSAGAKVASKKRCCFNVNNSVFELGWVMI